MCVQHNLLQGKYEKLAMKGKTIQKLAKRKILPFLNQEEWCILLAQNWFYYWKSQVMGQWHISDP